MSLVVARSPKKAAAPGRKFLDGFVIAELTKAPNSKRQTPEKHQFPRFKARARRRRETRARRGGGFRATGHTAAGRLASEPES